MLLPLRQFLVLCGSVAAAPLLLSAAVTYAEVAPLLASRCQGCHQPNEIGPMPLTSYKEVRPWAKAIKESVRLGTMPPWHADAETSSRYHNSRRLTEAERKLVVAWVDGGAAEGVPVAATPAAAKPDGHWRLGKPDMVVRIPGYRVPASGTLDYTFLVTPTNFPADTWIAAAEWNIDQRAVVHHINAFVRPPGSSYVAEAPVQKLYVASRTERANRHPNEKEADRRELLVGYEPGYRATAWGDGDAKLIRKGSDIVFEMHYTANGKAVEDHSELGLYFAKTPPRERVMTISPADAKLVIPPGDAAYRSDVSATFTKPVRLVSLQPHMHLRGKAYEVTLVQPDCKREVLLRVPKYDFNWQTTYFLEKPIDVPAGARLEYSAWFDNSANNRFNPDPKGEVRWGDQSWEEMHVGFTEVAFAADSDPEVATLSGTTSPGSAPKSGIR